VFDYKPKGITALEADVSTQFGSACKSFGIDIHTTHAPKLREKLNGSLKHCSHALPSNFDFKT